MDKGQLRKLSAMGSNALPSGVELMKRISEGSIQKAPSEYLNTVRTQVTENCDELLEVGARIRPLFLADQRVGWVRGIFNTERRRLSRWILDPNEYLIAVLTLATSFTRNDLETFSALELRNLAEVVQKMTEYDGSLFPYLSAFTSTLASENLWHGRSTGITSFENRHVELPDGYKMKILVPSEHARLWATLCTYREQAKVRLDANWNAVLQVRPMAGKSVDPLANELRALAKHLTTDSIEPWESAIKVRAQADLDDGWAHSENLDTKEGMLKELMGMVNNDRHEQLMTKFEQQQLQAAEERQRALEAMVRRRGGPGINEEKIEYLTEDEVRQHELQLKRGIIQPVDRGKSETTLNPVEKMKRYQ